MIRTPLASSAGLVDILEGGGGDHGVRQMRASVGGIRRLGALLFTAALALEELLETRAGW